MLSPNPDQASARSVGALPLALAARPGTSQRWRLLCWQVLARITGAGEAAQDPQDYATSPALAVPKALARAGIAAEDVDYGEVNEAFSVVDLVNRQLLGLDPERCALLGGSRGRPLPLPRRQPCRTACIGLRSASQHNVLCAGNLLQTPRCTG